MTVKGIAGLAVMRSALSTFTITLTALSLAATAFFTAILIDHDLIFGIKNARLLRTEQGVRAISGAATIADLCLALRAVAFV